MMKKIILTAAAVAAIATGTVASAPKAEAGYGISVGYSGGHYNGFSFGWGGGYGYNTYRPSCTYESYPVTVKVYDPYYYTYVYKTIYKTRKVCY
ncbi:MAG: hypothetical protein VX871_08605 [Pseudomonadota bacterium]|nr:hypothetical protein [Pseudomonadota bacterium]